VARWYPGVAVGILRAMTAADHHSEYLSRTVSALTPEGHARVDALLDQLSVAAEHREWLVRFAKARRAEADSGQLAAADDSPTGRLSRDELDDLYAGFATIRDQEPHDDVADWANAVVQLLKDALEH
jgi:hypothetical protein